MLNREEFSTYKMDARYTKSQCVRLSNPYTFRPSHSCISLMKSYEKLSKLPYWDQNGELISEYKTGATIGYGHLILNKNEFDKYKNGISEGRANLMFEEDIYSFIQVVRSVIKQKITQNEFDALVMLAFNIGVYAFRRSSIPRIINGDLSADLATVWKSYRYTQGRISRGLDNRRDAEINVFFNGVYFKK